MYFKCHRYTPNGCLNYQSDSRPNCYLENRPGQHVCPMIMEIQPSSFQIACVTPLAIRNEPNQSSNQLQDRADLDNLPGNSEKRNSNASARHTFGLKPFDTRK